MGRDNLGGHASEEMYKTASVPGSVASRGMKTSPQKTQGAVEERTFRAA
jgi:hypothetical protein